MSISRRQFITITGTMAMGLALSRCQALLNTHAASTINGEIGMNLLWKHCSDYTYLWWAKGLRDPDLVFNIQTSRYALAFDANHCRLLRLGRIASAPDEATALLEDNARVERLSRAGLSAWVEVNGKRCQVQKAGRTPEDHQLVESGKYFARRWQTFLEFEPGAPAFSVESGLELAAWPDRLTFLLRLEPVEALPQAVFGLTLAAPEGYTLTSGAAGNFLTGPDGLGFIVFANQPDRTITCDLDAQTCTIQVTAKDWAAGTAQSAGLVLYTQEAAPVDARVDFQREESRPVEMSALQTAPEARELRVMFQPEYGWYTIGLCNDGISPEREQNNQRIERVRIRIHNPDTQARTVRLNFQKESEVFGIAGISTILRDREGNPLGIPVQLSKNWHTGRSSIESKRFQGPWYRGLTMLAVPAGETIEFEYTSVNALWGTLPAASHAQLSLIGWGSNQLWEEAALGAWGENLCFEPDQGQVGGAVLDTRPLMVWAMENSPRQKWGWTNNVGGADFLVYYDLNADKQWNSRMKTHHVRNCPNLTEVTYAGTTYDRKIDVQYSVSLYRSDDITRGIYRFRYDVKEKVDFVRLILFQCGGEDYSYTGERMFAYGNEQGLLKEWATQWGSGKYRTERMELSGEIPWVSMHQAVSRDVTGNGAWANRGVIVRKWDAVLGGQACRPWIAERGVLVRNEDTSLIDFLPPPAVTVLQPGDYVEAEIAHVIVPQFAQDYYGLNANLTLALNKNQDTWKMILREANGNHLAVKVLQGGTLERSYPIQIRAEGQVVRFQVTGGLAYVPVTLRGLEDYRGWRLERRDGLAWKAIDQSVHGNDYWQTDFDALTQRWDLTYSLPLDSVNDERTTTEFRLTRKDSRS